MAARKRVLTPTQREIIKTMVKARRPQTTYKIAKRADRSWKATNDNLEILKKKSVVRMSKKKKVKSWILDI